MSNLASVGGVPSAPPAPSSIGSSLSLPTSSSSLISTDYEVGVVIPPAPTEEMMSLDRKLAAIARRLEVVEVSSRPGSSSLGSGGDVTVLQSKVEMIEKLVEMKLATAEEKIRRMEEDRKRMDEERKRMDDDIALLKRHIFK
jgi:hypothetical protein